MKYVSIDDKTSAYEQNIEKSIPVIIIILALLKNSSPQIAKSKKQEGEYEKEKYGFRV